MKKNLLAIGLFFGLVTIVWPSITNAWCCRRITWGFLNPPVVVHLGEVFEVSADQACLDTCSGSLSFCRNFFRRDATTDAANNTCVSATSGCCEVTATTIATDRFAYPANDQNECNTYCELLIGCTSVYSQGLVPNTNNGRCETPPATDTADNGTSSTTTTRRTTPVNYNYSDIINPLKTTSVPVVIGRIIRAFLAIVGSILLLIIIYGGILWMTAAGNASRVVKGRNTLMWGVLGVVAIFLAWILVSYIFEALGV